MTFEQAFFRVGLAGRELGSGPAVAAERIAPILGAVFDQVKVIEGKQRGIQLGVVIGLTMAEDPRVMEELELIHKEWMANR